MVISTKQAAKDKAIDAAVKANRQVEAGQYRSAATYAQISLAWSAVAANAIETFNTGPR